MSFVLKHFSRQTTLRAGLLSGAAINGATKPAAAAFSTLAPTTIKLRNPSLLPDVDPSRRTFEVRDPAEPGTVVGIVNAMDGKDARRVVEKSNAALPSWRDGTTAAERSRLLLEWSRLISENLDDVAEIMTRECGKPTRESIGEVGYARSFLDYYAAEAVRPTSAGGGFLVPTPFAQAGTSKPRGQIMAIQQAVGVTASITPWNFPIAMITRKVGPALAAGCTAGKFTRAISVGEAARPRRHLNCAEVLLLSP